VVASDSGSRLSHNQILFRVAGYGHQVIFFDGQSYISAKDARRKIGLTGSYAARLAKAGGFSARRLGHYWFVDQEAAEKRAETPGRKDVNTKCNGGNVTHKPRCFHRSQTRRHALQPQLRNSAGVVRNSFL